MFLDNIYFKQFQPPIRETVLASSRTLDPFRNLGSIQHWRGRLCGKKEKGDNRIDNEQQSSFS